MRRCVINSLAIPPRSADGCGHKRTAAVYIFRPLRAGASLLASPADSRPLRLVPLSAASHSRSGSFTISVSVGGIPIDSPFDRISPHPSLIAGWIWLFIRRLISFQPDNDGGHFLYAVSPRLHSSATKRLPFVTVPAGAMFCVAGCWDFFCGFRECATPRCPVEPLLKRGAF